MTTPTDAPDAPDDTDTTPRAEAPFPAFEYLQALTQRATPEERVEIDRAVSWLFMASASGRAANDILLASRDPARSHLIKHIALAGEIERAAQELVAPFAHFAEERLAEDEADAVMAFARQTLPSLFAAFAMAEGDDGEDSAFGPDGGEDSGDGDDGPAPTPDDAATEDDGPAVPATRVSPAAQAILRAVLDADPSHVNDLAAIIGAFAESYTAAAKRAKERGKPLDLTGVLTRAVPHFPKTAPEMAAALLPAFAEALGELPAEDWTVTTGRR